MRAGLVRAVVGVAAAVGMVLAGATPGYAARDVHVHEKIDGVAEIFGSTCPFGDWLPEVASQCEDWLVLLYRATNHPKQHNRVPWRLQLVRAAVLVHPDGTVDTLSEAEGFAENPRSTFDERHLLGASVVADVPMSDGTTRRVDVVWDGTASPLQTAGNNGPAIADNGISRHYVDRCFTVNVHAHQTYRANVGAAGTIDGTAVADIPYLVPSDPFLARGHFTVTVVTHGGCNTAN